MLHVILMILKILGIIIAAIVGILLLIVLAILFVPIRYKVRASYYNKPKAHVKISWLLHIINGRVLYDEKFNMRLRLLGFKLYDSDSEEKTPKIKKPKKQKESKKLTKLTESRKLQENETVEQFIETQHSKSVDQQVIEAEESNQPGESSKESFLLKISQFLHKIKNIFMKICDTIKAVYNKAITFKEAVSDKWNVISQAIQNEENREFVKFLMKQGKILWKHLKPRRYRIYVKYGSDDPATVGNVTAWVSVLNGFTGLRFEFIPVFDEKIIEGEIYLKGRICIGSMLIIAFRVYRNKQFKKLIHR